MPTRELTALGISAAAEPEPTTVWAPAAAGTLDDTAVIVAGWVAAGAVEAGTPDEPEAAAGVGEAAAAAVAESWVVDVVVGETVDGPCTNLMGTTKVLPDEDALVAGAVVEPAELEAVVSEGVVVANVAELVLAGDWVEVGWTVAAGTVDTAVEGAELEADVTDGVVGDVTDGVVDELPAVVAAEAAVGPFRKVMGTTKVLPVAAVLTWAEAGVEVAICTTTPIPAAATAAGMSCQECSRPLVVMRPGPLDADRSTAPANHSDVPRRRRRVRVSSTHGFA